MNIPAVIGLGEGLAKEYDGHMAAIDGFTGTIYIDPDEETMKAMTEKREEDRRQKVLLEELRGKENVTLSGQKINVYANIGNLSDVGAVLKNDAGGIGLFRSEFLYLESEDFPTEEQQFQVYKQVAENMAVLAMIRMAAENAHAEGKWIGICGELGADLELTEEFLAMGLDELSVSPVMVLPLRKKIRESK